MPIHFLKNKINNGIGYVQLIAVPGVYEYRVIKKKKHECKEKKIPLLLATANYWSGTITKKV